MRGGGGGAVPFYSYSIIYRNVPQNPISIIKAPTLYIHMYIYIYIYIPYIYRGSKFSSQPEKGRFFKV